MSQRPHQTAPRHSAPRPSRRGQGRVRVPLNVRPAIVGGLAVLLVAVGGFGTWAALAPLSSAVIAPGTVTVASKRKAVQHPDGGVVKELLVRDGHEVVAGDVIIRLDETRAYAGLAILQGSLDAARAVEARLIAERDAATAIAFPTSLLSRSVDPKVAKLMTGQETLFHARRDSLAGQLSILNERVGQLEQEIAGLEAQRRAKGRQIKLVREELKGLEQLLAKGYTERTRVLALQREAARLEGERGELSADIARANKAIGETKLQIIQAQKAFREQVVTELRDVQPRISDLEERAIASRDVFDKLEIRAPVSGVVVGMDVHTVGGVIRAGETVLEVVPAEDRLIIEAEVRPFDIDSVAVGQEATVRFTSFKQQSTPTVIGIVDNVSADSLVDERSGQPYYLCRVEVSEEEVSRLGARRLRPGMPAEVMIRIGDRTAIEYLAQPLFDSMARAWREE